MGKIVTFTVPRGQRRIVRQVSLAAKWTAIRVVTTRKKQIMTPGEMEKISAAYVENHWRHQRSKSRRLRPQDEQVAKLTCIRCPMGCRLSVTQEWKTELSFP